MPYHTESRVLPYAALQMYELVADVPSYPQFLPWCAAARIRSREPTPEGETMDAELMISFLAFRERFRSNIALRLEPLAIETEHVDGPFRFMNSAWAFRDVDGGCEVTFSVDFQLRNPILQTAIGAVFDDAMRQVVRAFERRAAQLHG